MIIYRLETKKYKWLLYFGLGQFALAILAQIMSEFTGQTSLLNIISALLDVAWFLTFPIGAIIAGHVSKQLNRAYVFWFIFTLFFSPIALILLSSKSYYVEPDINSIYRKFELKYIDSIRKVKQQFKKGKITQGELNDIQKRTLIELELKMNDEIQSKQIEIYTCISKPNYESRGEKIAYEKCPACGTKISEEEIDCSECGLSLK